jgi:hypothetical protein
MPDETDRERNKGFAAPHTKIARLAFSEREKRGACGLAFCLRAKREERRDGRISSLELCTTLSVLHIS